MRARDGCQLWCMHIHCAQHLRTAAELCLLSCCDRSCRWPAAGQGTSAAQPCRRRGPAAAAAAAEKATGHGESQQRCLAVHAPCSCTRACNATARAFALAANVPGCRGFRVCHAALLLTAPQRQRATRPWWQAWPRRATPAGRLGRRAPAHQQQHGQRGRHGALQQAQRSRRRARGSMLQAASCICWHGTPRRCCARARTRPLRSAPMRATPGHARRSLAMVAGAVVAVAVTAAPPHRLGPATRHTSGTALAAWRPARAAPRRRRMQQP